ncbi:MAG: polysaccharide deacetylase family protein [Porphyromonadaceae bacterium]|nr:polysaccharide deacetylase family protein [Porphyromonadaceae bacterium]
MKRYTTLLLVGLSLLLLTASCGSKQSKDSSTNDNELQSDTVEVTDLAVLTENLTLDDSDEDVQVFTIKIGNDPDKSHLTASFPFTKYEFINERERELSQQFIDEFKQEVAQHSSEETTALDFNQHFEVKYRANDFMVFLYTRSTSRGNNYDDTTHASIFDLEHNRPISTADLFVDEEAFEGFASEMRAATGEAVRLRLMQSKDFANDQERETVWIEMQSGIEEGTLPVEANYDALFFDDEGNWYVIFDKYQIASGSMGAFTVEVPQWVVQKYIHPDIQGRLRRGIQSEEPKEAPLTTELEQIEGTREDYNPSAPRVALTFDDGPSVYTSRLLDILKQEGVKATFFVLGKSAAVQKQTMKRMAEEGHNIGNHSYDHKNFAKISLDEARRQIERTDEIVSEVAGLKPSYFRFPYGAYTQDKLSLVGRPIISWNVDPLDWKYKDADRVAEEMSKARANAIILAHDIHKSTVEAIPQVIRNLKAKGYNIVTLDELFSDKELKNNHIYNSGK